MIPQHHQSSEGVSDRCSFFQRPTPVSDLRVLPACNNLASVSVGSLQQAQSTSLVRTGSEVQSFSAAPFLSNKISSYTDHAMKHGEVLSVKTREHPQNIPACCGEGCGEDVAPPFSLERQRSACFAADLPLPVNPRSCEAQGCGIDWSY